MLAACSGAGDVVVDTPADVLPKPEAPPSVSQYRWIEMAEVLRRHLPLPEGQRGIYLLTSREEAFVPVHGEPIAATCTEDWCRASMTRAMSSGDRVFRLDPSLGLLPIPKEQIDALRAKLAASATPDDPDVHTLKILSTRIEGSAARPDIGGFWREEGESPRNHDSDFRVPYDLPYDIESDPSFDFEKPPPEMRVFHAPRLSAWGRIDTLPELMGGGRADALLRPLADGSQLLTLILLPESCGSRVGRVHYVVPKGSQKPIKVFELVNNTMCAHEHPRGRTPEGLVSRPVEPADTEARFYATAAHLEAASVVAFERLARDLAAREAPAALVTAALDAAEDEKRHAEAMRRLGARHGVTETPVEVRAIAERSTLAIAIENAVEGCVNEAFAAVLCDYQAAAALDPALAAAMRTIADEEHRHAALAVRTATWLATRLSEAEQAAVHCAVADALQSLPRRARADAARAGECAATLGIPSPDRAAMLAERFVEFVRAA